MSITAFLKGRLRAARSKREIAEILGKPAPSDLPREDWSRSISNPTEFYYDAVRFFHHRLPREVREHRRYFSQQRRGFGEDAFHVLWFLLVREFRPQRFLEIGVYRGQTISLVALLSRLQKTPCSIHGISPFSSAGDSVSEYKSRLDYLDDTLRNFEHFTLPQPELLKAYSTDPSATALIHSTLWPAVYIDGNHDYGIARQDWNNVVSHLSPGGVVVLDDAALDNSFQPPSFATAGHPGPTRVAAEADAAQFEEILRIGHNRVFQRRA